MEEEPRAEPQEKSQKGHATAAIFACSPRAGGNSDLAAALTRDALKSVGAACELFTLRRFNIAPCVGCHICEQDQSGACFLTGRDQSVELFTPLLTADVVFLSAPIYYYHLPALLKSFIDRGQSYYIRKSRGDAVLTSLPRRKAWPLLVAGRPRGEKLFEGSLLTLRYFFSAFNFELGEPLLLRGVDELDDLRNNQEKRERIVAWTREAWAAVNPLPA